MKLSSLLSRFNEPETLKMSKMCSELRAKGVDVIDLSLGEPDFNTPQHIKEAAINAINENWSHYTPVAGYADVKEAICQKLKRDNNLTYTASQIVVSTGAKQSIANAMMAVLDEGDEIIIPTPYWVSYSEIAKLARANVVFIPTNADAAFKITAQQLKEAITPKTKMFIFSTPCNPSGAVYSKDELAQLAAVFDKHPEIYVISDEIYEYINYKKEHNEPCESLAGFNEIKDRVIIINGLSKGFAMTGWRLGYMAANEEIAKACEKIQGQITSGANSIAQRATIAALTSSLEPTFEMVDEFKKRKEKVMELMSGIKGIKCFEPEGAFYVFPEVKSFFGKKYGDTKIQSSSDLCMYLLHEAHVSTVAGDAFGAPDYLRISFANSMENLVEAFNRIKLALGKL